MVAQGAISEADRRNIRGERISVDTIPLVGEERLSTAVRAVARLDRARVLVLAGSLMGGDITHAVREIQGAGITVVCTSMAGSVVGAADLVVTDPLEAGVMAVMLIADRSEEHTSELQSQSNLVCRLLLEKKKRRHDISSASTDPHFCSRYDGGVCYPCCHPQSSDCCENRP